MSRKLWCLTLTFLWTEDQDFFGSGVATWTTSTVTMYLIGAE